MKKSEFEKIIWKCTKVEVTKNKKGRGIHVFQFQSNLEPKLKAYSYQVDSHLDRWLKQLGIEEPFQAEGKNFRIKKWNKSNSLFYWVLR